MKKSKETDTWHYWEMIVGYARKDCISCYPREGIWRINLSFLLLSTSATQISPIFCSCMCFWCQQQHCGPGIQSSFVSRTEGKRWRHVSRGLSDVHGELMFLVLLCNTGHQILSNKSAHVFCNNYLCVCVCLWNVEQPELWDPMQRPPLLRYKVQGYMCIIICI